MYVLGEAVCGVGAVASKQEGHRALQAPQAGDVRTRRAAGR